MTQRKEIIWVKIPFSPAEIERLSKSYPKSFTSPGRFWSSIRQALKLTDSPVGLNNDNYTHVETR